MQQISQQDARRLALQAQGLWGKIPFRRGKAGALAAIHRLGYIQIDTISVIRRTHHHTIWVRVPGYNMRHLHELQAEDKQIFEYWSHAAAYLPMEDYRYSLPLKQRLSGGEKHWHDRDPKLMRHVLNRVEAEGPLQARDFDKPVGFKHDAMWSWKPAKRALEQLFMEGELMIAERRGFQKVFDLSERVLPAWVDKRRPSEEEWARHHVLRCLGAHGFASLAEINYLRKKVKPFLSQALKDMTEAGEILDIEVEGLDGKYYTLQESLDRLPLKGARKRLHLLSPFDNALIQRKRISQVFDFEYQVEIYVPAHKRVHGYFSLPILWGDQFVGRLDPKADKKSKTLFIRALHMECRPAMIEEIMKPLVQKLIELAHFNACETVHIEQSLPPQVASHLNQVLISIHS